MRPFFILFLFIHLPAVSQVDTIDIARDLNMKVLEDGTEQYQVFVARPDGVPRYVALWNRTIRHTVRDGAQRLVVEQQWWTNDSAGRREVYSECDPKTFAPLYHYARFGNGRIEAFVFRQDSVVCADSVADNSRRGFSVPLTMPTLNWELDLEIFQVLPYAEGKEFVIAFYHPGGPPPAYHSYKVSGSEKIPLAGGGLADCWLLTFEYRGSTATFWVSKDSREVLKSMDEFPGGYRYKVKLATSMRPRGT